MKNIFRKSQKTAPPGRNIQGSIIRNGQVIHNFVLDLSNGYEFVYDEQVGDIVEMFGFEPVVGTLTISEKTNPTTPEDLSGIFNKTYTVV